MPRKSDRKKGGHNRSFFFRKPRGWRGVDGSGRVSLQYEDGTPITAADAVRKIKASSVFAAVEPN